MIVLDFYPDWGHSPERFLEFIKVTAALSALHKHAEGLPGPDIDETELAQVFIATFKIDLGPYKHYAQLEREAALKIDLLAILNHMRDESRADDEFYDLVDEGQLQLSMETMLEEGFSEYKSRGIVNALRPYIDFV